MVDLDLHVCMITLISVLRRVVELDEVCLPAHLMHNTRRCDHRLGGKNSINELLFISTEPDGVRIVAFFGLLFDCGQFILRQESELIVSPVSVGLARAADGGDVDRRLSLMCGVVAQCVLLPIRSVLLVVPV